MKNIGKVVLLAAISFLMLVILTSALLPQKLNHSTTSGSQQRPNRFVKPANIQTSEHNGVKALFFDPTGPVPTNRIWSAATFTGTLPGLYLYPFAAKLENGRLKIDVPTVGVSEKVITNQIGGESIEIIADKKIESVFVHDYSDLTVTLRFVDDTGSDQYWARFIQGSAYVFLYPKQSNLSITSTSYMLSDKQEMLYFHRNTTNIGIYSSVTPSINKQTLDFKFNPINQEHLTLGFFASENVDAPETLIRKQWELVKNYSGNIITSVNASFTSNVLESITNYDFTFENLGQATGTIFGLLPHQQSSSRNFIYKLPTLKGIQQFIELKTQVSIRNKRIPIQSELLINKLSASDRQVLLSLLEQDLKETILIQPSVYFGGIVMLKLAKMLDIAQNIGALELSTRISDVLQAEFADWANWDEGETGKYFSYDKSVGSLIGYETSGFGGEVYNDHHFHYGYFILSAAILGKYNPDFVVKYKDFINALADDIATFDRKSAHFPYLRNFDLYNGHSWANGFADSADGNNQESSSEAINAWYGVNLWAKLTNNLELAKVSDYLYSTEVATARIYWLNWDNNKQIFPEAYSKNKASLVWGGKTEYNTWFSSQTSAIEGIQYLPFTAGSLYLFNPDILARDYNSYKVNLGNTSSALSDMNLLYYTMLKGSDLLQLEKIRSLKVDVSQSRAFMYQWLLFWNDVDKIKVIDKDSEPIYSITPKASKTKAIKASRR